MRRVSKPVFFIIAVLILLFAVVSVTGVSTRYGDVKTVRINGIKEIRWGIDIRGGVDVTFTVPEGVDATDAQLESAAEVMRQRLLNLNITDYEVYTDNASDRVIVRFPWQADDTDFDAEAAIEELGETAVLTFRYGTAQDGDIILQGSNVTEAKAIYAPTDNTGSTYAWQVSLELDDEGAEAFATATAELSAENGQISIWMDDTCISAPSVSTTITGGSAVITGNFDSDSATALANKINAGALPFEIVTESYSTINATLGEGARDAMIISCIIAFVLICILMIAMYRLPGIIACLCLLGQICGTLAALTGFFPFISSFTLTIPGIAGIILAIGFGVDANVITAERIKEEIRSGKSIDGSIELGYKRAFSAIIDGNLTVIIVAIILMGTFGTSGSVFAKLLKPLMFMFPASSEGSIYSFGYTLLVGVICNFIFGVFASKYMLKSISGFKCFRKPTLYGGEKNAEK